MLDKCGNIHSRELFKAIAEYIVSRYGVATWSLVESIVEVEGIGQANVNSILSIVKRVFGEESRLYSEILGLVKRMCSEEGLVSLE